MKFDEILKIQDYDDINDIILYDDEDDSSENLKSFLKIKDKIDFIGKTFKQRYGTNFNRLLLEIGGKEY